MERKLHVQRRRQGNVALADKGALIFLVGGIRLPYSQTWVSTLEAEGVRGDGEMVRTGRDEALLGEPGDMEDLEEVGGGRAELGAWDGHGSVDIVVSVMLLVPEDGCLLGEISPTGISKGRVTEAGRKGERVIGVGTGLGARGGPWASEGGPRPWRPWAKAG